MICYRLPFCVKLIVALSVIPMRRCQNMWTIQGGHLRQRRSCSIMLEHMVGQALSPLNSSCPPFLCISDRIIGQLNRLRSSSVTFLMQNRTCWVHSSAHPSYTKSLTNYLIWWKLEVSASYTDLARLILILFSSMGLEACR